MFWTLVVLAMQTSNAAPVKRDVGKQQKAATQRDSTAISAPLPTATLPVGAPTSQPGAAPAENKGKSDPWTEPMAVLTAGLLFIAGVQAILFVRQLRIMNQGLIGTKAAADAAKRSADAANESIVLAKQTAEAQATDVRASLELAQRSAEAATLNANAARDSAQALMSSQRAWVSWVTVDINRFDGGATFIDEQRNSTYAPAASGILFAIRWMNAGQTPAIHTTVYGASRIVEATEPVPIFEQAAAAAHQGKATALIPHWPVGGPPQPITTDQIARLKTREIRVFLFGTADYETVFPGDTRKHSEVCLEILFTGTDASTGKDVWSHTPVGTQQGAS